MNEPTAWRETDSEEHPVWRKVFNEDWTGSDLVGPCPVCGARALHRWYLLEDNEAKVFRGIRFSGRGRLWEWCSVCRTFEHYPDGHVPEWWISPYDVQPESLRYDPAPVEEARMAAR
ncbi:MAG: hypothetical protein JF597_32300 [Streptomyces sp.]|jgi:hypothetical protein|uniref:hypothetical protein n=1 Tax=Streptomyces sp. TaxID=1931 RepID=UPI0025D8BCC7|nr:hypothetical protein [Streptomyces sp.]MBW8798102.1 hypothetical protein [Streptomyces sp.]